MMVGDKVFHKDYPGKHGWIIMKTNAKHYNKPVYVVYWDNISEEGNVKKSSSQHIEDALRMVKISK